LIVIVIYKQNFTGPTFWAKILTKLQHWPPEAVWNMYRMNFDEVAEDAALPAHSVDTPASKTLDVVYSNVCSC
jgi:hypothetical protein